MSASNTAGFSWRTRRRRKGTPSFLPSRRASISSSEREETASSVAFAIRTVHRAKQTDRPLEEHGQGTDQHTHRRAGRRLSPAHTGQRVRMAFALVVVLVVRSPRPPVHQRMRPETQWIALGRRHRAKRTCVPCGGARMGRARARAPGSVYKYGLGPWLLIASWPIPTWRGSVELGA